MNYVLKAAPLTAAALAPYATVLRAPERKAVVLPEVLEKGDVPGHHAFTILCPNPVDASVISVSALERHAHSTQSFLPITAGRWLVLVAPTAADGSPNLSGAKAFVAGPEDAICIGRNVWHAGLTVFDQPAEFGMVMWKADAGDDGILHQLDTPIAVTI
ncbi:ureidoglycolate lyase [Devosia epidermidihirudinis]|uniref:ureidoglycolate lyase n=1 Tax=Devosia epidermidihirudinis TaxID=1293439 RepID=UPI000696FE33|nr:ureidoglycolate lyase [Devosia epidermidihirudinis]